MSRWSTREPVPTAARRGARRRRGHAHALRRRRRCCTRCAAGRWCCTWSTRSSQLPLERIVVVVGHGAERVTKTLQEQLATEVPVEFVEQRVAARHRRRGRASRSPPFADDLDAEDDVLVLPGDDAAAARRDARRRSPPSTALADAAATLLTARARRPDRATAAIVRDERRTGSTASSSRPTRTPEELEIDEINTSIYCFRRSLLAPALRRLSPENAQGEYYLTDVDRGAAPGRAQRASRSPADDPTEALGVNDRAQLADAEAELRAPHQPPLDARRRRRWSTPRAPTSTRRSSSSPTCACCRARSSRAAPSIGAGSVIGPDAQLVDTVVGERRGRRATPSPARPRSATTCHGRPVRRRCGRARGSPPARRSARSSRSRTPRSARARRCRTSRTSATPRSGRGANIGAGTITANYDGAHKHRTEGRRRRAHRLEHRAGRAGRGRRRRRHRRRVRS